jgi:pimeloyl-ACP methyl ester carboxylesterase
MTKKKLSIDEGFVLSQKMGLLVLIGTIMFATTFAVTGHSGTANAQENKTLSQPQGTQGMVTNNTKMNIVLVHGAWADAGSWDKVIPILQKAGHHVIAVELPEHSLADDIATTKRAINLIGGPVTLVGHSYGGMVITNAGYNNPNVKNLVYIAAFAPKEGQSIGEFVNPSMFPPGALKQDEAGFVYWSNPKFLHDLFAQELDPVQASILWAVQKPINAAIFGEKSGPPAWKQHPTWYQVSDNDRTIPPDIERMFAKQINATTISLPSSHVSYISHPNEVADFILNATKGK